MLWLAIYLYIAGSAMMWWWARAQKANVRGKITAAVFWPILVPWVALFG